jgi:hypothetical protein
MPPRRRLAGDPDLAAVEGREAYDAAERGRLPRSVRPEHGDELAQTDVQVEPVEYSARPEALPQAADSELRLAQTSFSVR